MNLGWRPETSFASTLKRFTRCEHALRSESYARATPLARPGVTYPYGVSSRCYLERDGMSITEGMTGGGSWSSHRTLRAFPTGPGWKSHGRGVLKPTLWELGLLASIPFGAGAARFAIPRAISLVQKPLFWVGVNAYQEGQDMAAWIRGEEMGLQLAWKGRPVRGPHPMYGPIVIPVAFPYLDFTKSPSSGVGGPGEIPNLHRPPPSIEETGKLISNPPMAGDVPSSPRPSTLKKAGSKRRKRCPPGHHYSTVHRRCVKTYPGWQKHW